MSEQNISTILTFKIIILYFSFIVFNFGNPDKNLLTKTARLKVSRLLTITRPWPNDQTLFVKHLKFSYQTQCLTVWLHQKSCSSKIFLLDSSMKCFWKLSKTNERCLPSNVLWHSQTFEHCSDLKCLINNVWSFPKWCVLEQTLAHDC